MVFFDLNEPVIEESVSADFVNDCDALYGEDEDSDSANVINDCDASDGVAEDSVSANVVNAFDALDGVVEESVSADVVNASDSSSSDVVAVSNDDQNSSCKFIFAFYKYHL